MMVSAEARTYESQHLLLNIVRGIDDRLGLVGPHKNTALLVYETRAGGIRQ
jgi:hypothetical protein